MRAVEDAVATSPPPASWEADVVLRDGHTVRVRPISPDDGEALLRFHSRQSAESVYFRYFSPRPELSERDVRHFTHVDHVDRVAFVAVLGTEIIGVARYERYRGTDTAEVAFFVDDEHHGRGLATIMLEYLAAAGRERGLRRFVASTLPNNRRMLAVFAAAGYDVATRIEDGVVEIAFDINPTEDSLAAMERRERHAEAASVRRLLEPSSVAVVGAGGARRPDGRRVLANLARFGYAGRLLAVDGAEGGAVDPDAVEQVASVAELPEGVDLVVAATPAEEVPGIVESCGERGVGSVVILSGGFAQPAGDGRTLEQQVVDSARRHGLRVLGPKCLGLVNTAPGVRLHATVTAAAPPAGPVGVLAESGTLAASIVALASRSGLGMSTFVAAGNPADVTAADLLSYWTEDDATRAVLLYLGAGGLPSRFVRAARAASLAKPVAALHTSLSPAGSSQLGRHAGRDGDRRAEAMFRQTGVISVGTLEQLFDLGRLLTDQPVPAGSGCAVVGDSDGAVALVAEACRGSGLDVVEVSGTTSSGIRWANPVDLTDAASAADFAEALDAVASHPEVASVVVLSTPPELSSPPEVVQAILDASARHRDVTFAATVLGADGARLGDAAGGVAVPLYEFPEHAARSIGRLAAYRDWRAGAEVHGGSVAAVGDEQAAEEVLDAVTAPGAGPGPEGGLLGNEDAERLLAAYGVKVAERRTVADSGAALAAARELGWPVALKAARRDRARRSALGGVALDLALAEDLLATWERMEAELGEGMHPAAVQRFLDRGVDVAVRVDAGVGDAATVEVGLGGPATLVERWELGVLPLRLSDASALVASSSVGRALTDPLERVPVVELVHRLAHLVEAHDRVRRVEANPVVVTGPDAWVADVDVVVGPPRRGLAVRRLD